MQLPYRPKYLGGRTTFASKPAPEPHVAPAALYAEAEDPRRPYTPGASLHAQDGLILLRDGPAGDWPDGRGPGEPPRPTPPVWRLWLEGAALIAAIVAGGIIGVGFVR